MELAETALSPPEATVWFGDIELHINAMVRRTELCMQLQGLVFVD